MREDKYLDKAIALFKKEGVSMPIEEIAEKIGVSKKTLYNNFESKDGLIGKCMKRVLEDLQDRLTCLNDESRDIKECFTAGILALRDFFRESSPVFLNEMFKLYPGITKNEHAAGMEYFVEKLQQHIARGQKENKYRKNIDTRLIAGYISFSVFSYFRRAIMMEGSSSASHYFDQVIELNYNALIIK